MTGRDLVKASLRLIGVLAPGESLEAEESTDGLAALNRMLDSWSNDGLLIPSRTRETHTLTAGDGDYTWGSGGDIATTRPIAIEEAAIRDESGTDAVEYPLAILSLDEWQRILVKDTQSTLPECLFDDGGYPTRTLRLYPVPSAAHKLVLWSQKPLTTIASLSTDISMQPGAERALVYNGAVELASEYGKLVPNTVAAIAMESLARLKRANKKPHRLRIDDVPVGSGRAYNILTGRYGR